MVELVDSSFVIVTSLVALAVFALVVYLLVRMSTHNSNKDSETGLPQTVNPEASERH